MNFTPVLTIYQITCYFKTPLAVFKKICTGTPAPLKTKYVSERYLRNKKIVYLNVIKYVRNSIIEFLHIIHINSYFPNWGSEHFFE